MTYLNILKKKTSSFIVALLVFIFLSILLIQLVDHYKMVAQRHDEHQLETEKEFIYSRITDLFNDAYDATKLIDFVQVHASISTFDTVAKDILSETDHFKNLRIVEGTTITHVFPLKGNEDLIGNDVFKDPKISFGAYQAIEDSTIFFAGPYQLKGGGFGILGRLPHFINNICTGFSIVQIDWEQFIKATRIKPNNKSNFDYLATTVYPEGEKEYFLSTPSKFSEARVKKITFPNSNLSISIKQKDQQNYFAFFLPYYGFAVFIAFYMAFFLWYKLNENIRIKSLVNVRTSELTKSREEYKLLFDEAGDMITISDENGNIKDVNKKMCEFTEYSREELLKMNISDYHLPEDLLENQFRWDLVDDNQSILQALRIQTKSGIQKTIEVNTKKIINNEILGIARDKTEINQLNKRNTEIEKMLKAGFDGTSMGIAYTELDGSWTHVNKALTKITGYSKSELIELSFQKISHPDDLQSGIEFIQQAKLNQRNNYNTVKRYIHKLGHIIWVEVHITAVQNNQNEIQFLIAHIEDISDKVRLENDLLQEKKFSDRVINSLPGILYVTNEKKEIIRVSEKVIEITQKKKVEIIGHKINEFMVPYDAPAPTVQPNHIYLHGKTENEYEYVANDGTIFTYFVVNTVIDLEDGQGTLAIGIDISKMKEYEAQLLEFQKKVIERNKELKCLYIASEYSIDPKLTNTERFHKIASILPSAFLYPEGTFARIVYNGAEFLSENFQRSDYTMKENILEMGEIVGELEIFFSNELPMVKGITSLYEEQNLVSALSKIICAAQEKRITLNNLKKSEEKYRYLFENLPGTASIWDPETLVWMEVNIAFTALFESSREELVGKSIKNISPPNAHASIDKFAKQLLLGKEYKARNTWEHITSSGRRIFVDITSLRINYNGKKAVLAVGFNVTDLVHADEKQKELTSDIRRLKSNIETVRDEERLSLSRELHDDLGQKLTLMNLYLSMLENDLLIEAPEKEAFNRAMKKEITEQFIRVYHVIKESIHTVRNLSDSLRLGVLGNSGLLEAIQNQCYKTKDLYKIDCECIIQENLLEKHFKEPIAKEIYRIFQETGTNIIRHAEASKVNVNLSLEDGQFVMEIVDNGKGFNDQTMRKNSLGLLGMQERAFLINGEVHIESKVGVGTTVIFKVATDVIFEN